MRAEPPLLATRPRVYVSRETHLGRSQSAIGIVSLRSHGASLRRRGPPPTDSYDVGGVAPFHVKQSNDSNLVRWSAERRPAPAMRAHHLDRGPDAPPSSISQGMAMFGVTRKRLGRSYETSPYGGRPPPCSVSRLSADRRSTGDGQTRRPCSCPRQRSRETIQQYCPKAMNDLAAGTLELSERIAGSPLRSPGHGVDHQFEFN